MTISVRLPASATPIIQTVDQIGALATEALRLELETWPKPGLVSLVDSGSHADMNATTLGRSIEALAPFLAELGAAGASAASMGELRRIGLAAEGAMLRATGGVNTHRGAIFGLGLLSAAAGARLAGIEPKDASLGGIVRRRWGSAILDGPIQPASHGAKAGRQYGAGGARLEAASGFPSLYGVGLPALGPGLAGQDRNALRVRACFALIAHLEDTNLLHRGGPAGLAFARREARRFLDEGGIRRPDWPGRAVAVHRDFVARRLSPGGSADLLAMALFVRAVEPLAPVLP